MTWLYLLAAWCAVSVLVGLVIAQLIRMFPPT